MESIRKSNGHILLVPFPAQGHFKPVLKLSHCLADHGINVTLVVTELIHERIISEFEAVGSSSLSQLQDSPYRVRLVSVPDGLEPGDNREDLAKLTKSISRIMPGYLEELINKEKITCVVGDVSLSWLPSVSERMGVKRAVFFPSSPGILAMILNIPKLIQDGLIDSTDGSPTRDDDIDISPELPALSASEFVWKCPRDESLQLQGHMFAFLHSTVQTLKLSDFVLCNWFHDLVPSITSLIPNLLPIGPLVVTGQKPTGNFWSEDVSCLNWLDKHAPGSVIYVAFGSTTEIDQNQLNELALGLELSARPFLWVIGPNTIKFHYPDGFMERIAMIGKIVQWAPQEKVLAHTSVACFVTHSGWNSTLEAISMGVPLLCFPGHTDQLYTRSCICKGWKIGLSLKEGEDRTFTRYDIKSKLEELLLNEGIRANLKKLKELAEKSVSAAGSSYANFKSFVDQTGKE